MTDAAERLARPVRLLGYTAGAYAGLVIGWYEIRSVGYWQAEHQFTGALWILVFALPLILSLVFIPVPTVGSVAIGTALGVASWWMTYQFAHSESSTGGFVYFWYLLAAPPAFILAAVLNIRRQRRTRRS